MNIDRIAREMVDIEPSRDLEARIRARLDALGPDRRAVWWSWRVAVPMGAAAAIAIAVVLQRPTTTSLPVEVAPPSVVAQMDSPAVAAPAGALAKPGPGVVTASRRLKAAPSLLSAEELAWMERRMPALDPVTALQMDRLLVDSIQPEPLGITPLTMTPVATESGGIERRNDR